MPQPVSSTWKISNSSSVFLPAFPVIYGLNDIIMEECGDTEIYAHAKDVQSAAKNLNFMALLRMLIKICLILTSSPL